MAWVFFLMSQRATFHVVNHLHNPTIVGIYGTHLNSIGKKKFQTVPNWGKFSLSLWVLIYGQTMIARLYTKSLGVCVLLLFTQVLFSSSSESYTECHGKAWSQHGTAQSPPHMYDSESLSPNTQIP